MTGTEFLIASTIFSAVGSIAGGMQAKKAGEFNAAMLRNQAKANRDAAEEKGKREARLGAKRMGTLRSLDPNKLDLLEDSAMEEELNVQTIIHAGEVEAVGNENSARLALAKGNAAMTSGVMGAAGSVLMAGAIDGGAFTSTGTS